ncbi:hypothetical protein [Kitasatospora sp. NPDC005856]|uniref:hypothetical protein n=1 Tax=Kitasatospora sp. NPDC005856 TaxID=3154566 RepID=UPI0033EBD26F
MRTYHWLATIQWTSPTTGLLRTQTSSGTVMVHPQSTRQELTTDVLAQAQSLSGVPAGGCCVLFLQIEPNDLMRR